MTSDRGKDGKTSTVSRETYWIAFLLFDRGGVGLKPALPQVQVTRFLLVLNTQTLVDLMPLFLFCIPPRVQALTTRRVTTLRVW